MTVERINPVNLSRPQSYTHIVVATGHKLVFVAGQVSEDTHGHLVGPGDMAVQAGQAFANVGRALSAAGAQPEQVAKLTIFVVHFRDEYLPLIERARVAAFGDHKPADTLVGVEALAHAGCLIEIDAVAVVDD